MKTIWILVLALFTSDVNSDVPFAAQKYRQEMTRSAYRILGPSAPIPLLAGQIHQESAWDKDAKSRVGALGLAQFMPLTAKDMATRFPSECSPANPFSPKWAFNCRDRYMSTLLRATKNEQTSTCSNWMFALRAYNGGLGWIRKDQRLTEESGFNRYLWSDVEKFNNGRADWAFEENTEYPRRIFKHQYRYSTWGSTLGCLDE
jgi:soluble lytic murein transglycosylase-like protein